MKARLDNSKILVLVYGHVADTMAAIPGLRSLRAAYPSATIEVLALESARPILGPCPYIDRLIPWRDFQHKGERGARLEKLGVIASLVLRLRRRHYDATLVFHRSSGAMRKLAEMVGSPIRAGVSYGGESYTHPVPHRADAESSRDENRRVLDSIGVSEDGGAVELWTADTDAVWAAAFLGQRSGPRVGLHPGSDWSCQQWLPKRFGEVGGSLQAATGATIVITGSSGETVLEAEIAQGLAEDPLRACGRTTFEQFVEIIRRLDLLVCVNSAAAAIAAAVGTPAVVLLGLEDARFTGIKSGGALTVIQPRMSASGGGWCEFGRWGVLSGCDSPMCRGLGGLAEVESAAVVEQALGMLRRESGQTGTSSFGEALTAGAVPAT
jgi:ADP-heptose:LPS heptosyltransferase